MDGITGNKAENEAAWPARVVGIIFDHFSLGGLDACPDFKSIQSIGGEIYAKAVSFKKDLYQLPNIRIIFDNQDRHTILLTTSSHFSIRP